MRNLSQLRQITYRINDSEAEEQVMVDFSDLGLEQS